MRYRRKDIPDAEPVEAWRWERNARTDGLEVMEPELKFSQDGRLFYVSGVYPPPAHDGRGGPPRDWLSVDPGEDGKYDVYPFTLYKVRSGGTRPAEKDDQLVQLYLNLVGSEDMPLPMVFTHGRFPHSQDTRKFVVPGQWVVEEPYGMGFFPWSDEEFQAVFEAVPE